MDREEIIRMAREAGLAYGSDEKPLGSVTRFAALVAAAERNKLAAWMMSQGYATGHGDTVEDLLKELEWQIAEREREACAKVCDEKVDAEYKTGKVDHHEMGWTQACAIAIRARGEAEYKRGEQ
jgi:hypothetical protein